MVEDLDLDRKGGTKKEKHRWGLNALNKMKHDFNLADIWCTQNPQRRCFSWHSFSQNIQSRLDRFYITNNCFTMVEAVDPLPCSISDHDYVGVELAVTDVTPQVHFGRHCL